MASEPTVRVLAVASAGGHWMQLRRLRPAFEGARVTWVTTNKGYAHDAEAGERFAFVLDANRWQKARMLVLLLQTLWLVLTRRPQVVVTTGAAPGFWAIRFSKLVGARSMWIDSVANAEELSMAGRLASNHADACLTQWSHLETDTIRYRGSVL